MWIISKHQLTAISNSIRNEFEQRACFVITKERLNLPKDEVKRIVHVQTDKIILYNINMEEAMMQFIHLSFRYPALRLEILPKSLHDILSSEFDDSVKIENMINLLNNNDYAI